MCIGGKSRLKGEHMNSPLSIWKNIIWLVGLAICLVALLVGFIAAALGNPGINLEDSANLAESGALTADQATGQLYTVAESADGGQAYLDGLTFLVDSSLIGLRDYALVGPSQVWGSSAGNIPADTLADPVIRLPANGTETSAAAAVSAMKPAVLIISLGMDSINDTDEATFIADYTSLVNSIRAQSPDTKIVLCSVCSVTGGYSGTDGMSNTVAQNVNAWIEAVCKNTGVYYMDLASAVCDSSGSLFNEYAGANGKMLNSTGLSKVLEYLRCHVV